MISKPRAKRWLLSFAAATLCLLCLEAAMWVWRGSPDAANHHRIFCQYDAKLGWVLQAGRRHRRVTREYDHIETVNRHGMRDRERNIGQPAARPRILVLGDSFVEGYSVGDTETFTRVLEAKLVGAARQFDVINAGVGGYSTDQEFIWLRTHGAAIKPAAVVLAFYRNDIKYNARADYDRGPKPHFKVDHGALVEPPVPPGPESLRRRPVGWHRWTAPLASVSHTYYYLRGLRWQLRAHWRGKSRQPSTRWDLQLAETPQSDPVRTAWLATDLLIAELARLVRSRGAALYILWVPHHTLVYPGSDPSGGSVAVLRGLESIAVRHDIALINPLPALLAKREALDAAGGGERVYYARDRHWTKHGHAAVAGALMKSLSWASMTPASSSATATTAP